MTARTVLRQLGGAESLPEAVLANRCERHGLPKPQTQVKLIENRQFRYDLVFEPWKVAVEVQGAVYSNGRHTRGQGYENDALKSALAQIEGFIVLAVTPGMVESGAAIYLIDRALRAHGWPA